MSELLKFSEHRHPFMEGPRQGRMSSPSKPLSLHSHCPSPGGLGELSYKKYRDKCLGVAERFL